jgi:hypothetical protein
MGNFRGVYPQRQAEWRKKEEYWQNVGLYEYAEQDISIFIEKIREIKREELRTMLKGKNISKH